MRVVGGVVLWVVATIIGLSAAGWFSLSGVGWPEPPSEYPLPAWNRA